MFIISGQTVLSVILEFRNKRTLWRICEKKRCAETINLLDPGRAIPDHGGILATEASYSRLRRNHDSLILHLPLSPLSVSLSVDMSYYCKSQKITSA